MRYFFDIHDRDNIALDELGTEFSTFEAAQREAIALLPQLAGDLPLGAMGRDLATVVKDSSGTTVFFASLSLVGVVVIETSMSLCPVSMTLPVPAGGLRNQLQVPYLDHTLAVALGLQSVGLPTNENQVETAVTLLVGEIVPPLEIQLGPVLMPLFSDQSAVAPQKGETLRKLRESTVQMRVTTDALKAVIADTRRLLDRVSVGTLYPQQI